MSAQRHTRRGAPQASSSAGGLGAPDDPANPSGAGASRVGRARLVVALVLVAGLEVLAAAAGALGLASTTRYGGDTVVWIALLAVALAAVSAASLLAAIWSRALRRATQRDGSVATPSVLVTALTRRGRNDPWRRALRRAASLATAVASLFVGLLVAGVSLAVEAHGLYTQSQRLAQHGVRAVGTVQAIDPGGSLAVRSVSLSTSLVVVRVAGRGRFSTAVVSDPTGTSAAAGSPALVPGEHVALLVDPANAANAAFPGNPLVPSSKLVGLAVVDVLLAVLAAWAIALRVRVGRQRRALLPRMSRVAAPDQLMPPAGIATSPDAWLDQPSAATGRSDPAESSSSVSFRQIALPAVSASSPREATQASPAAAGTLTTLEARPANVPAARLARDAVDDFAAAWYRDPTARHGLRYFDGNAWTHWVSDGDGVAATDPLGAAH